MILQYLFYFYQNYSTAIGGRILYYKRRKCKNKTPNFSFFKKKSNQLIYIPMRTENSPHHEMYSRKMSIRLN